MFDFVQIKKKLKFLRNQQINILNDNSFYSEFYFKSAIGNSYLIFVLI